MAGLPLVVVVAGGSGGLGLAALTLARPDLAVAVGLTLMVVVEFEPAPPDAAFALIIAVAVVTGRFRLSRAPAAVVVLIGALVLLNIVSMLAAVDMVAALRYSLITAFLAVLGLWLTGWVDSAGRARTVVVTWLAGAVLSALVGIAVVYLPFTFPGREVLMDGTLTRANVLFEDANVYGPFLIPIAVIVLEERLRPRLLRCRPAVLVLLFLVLAVGILVSFSRAGWINFVVAVLVMLGVTALRRRGGRAAVRMLLTLGIAAGAVVGVMALTGSLSFFEERAQIQSYDTERFDAQRAGVELATQYPLGVGPGQFRFHHAVETHSTYVRVLAEQGVLGLAVWVALAAGTLFLAARNALHGWDTHGIGSAALLGSWCGLLVNSAVVDTLHWRHLWVVAALIWVAAVRRRSAESECPSREAQETPTGPQVPVEPGSRSVAGTGRSPSGPG
ncbi:O-antigen ligase family protein [Geodermatophilus sp. SYSU D00684]